MQVLVIPLIMNYQICRNDLHAISMFSFLNQSWTINPADTLIVMPLAFISRPQHIKQEDSPLQAATITMNWICPYHPKVHLSATTTAAMAHIIAAMIPTAVLALLQSHMPCMGPLVVLHGLDTTQNWLDDERFLRHHPGLADKMFERDNQMLLSMIAASPCESVFSQAQRNRNRSILNYDSSLTVKEVQMKTPSLTKPITGRQWPLTSLAMTFYNPIDVVCFLLSHSDLSIIIIQCSQPDGGWLYDWGKFSFY